jgi:hypothetical protein
MGEEPSTYEPSAYEGEEELPTYTECGEGALTQRGLPGGPPGPLGLAIAQDPHPAPVAF